MAKVKLNKGKKRKAARPKRGQHCKWSENAMLSAIEAVRKKQMSQRAASKTFGVPRCTLQVRLCGKTEVGAKAGHPTLLSLEQEQMVVDYACNRASMGIGFGQKQFLQYAADFAKEHQLSFKNGRPSLRWWCGLKKRHQGLRLRQPEDIVMFSSIPIDAESTQTTTTIERTLKEDIYETLEPTTYVKLNYNLAQRRSNVYTTLSTTATAQQPATTSTESAGDQETTKSQSTVASMVAAAESSAKKSNPRFQTELQQTLSSRGPSEPPRPGSRPAPPRVPQKLTKSLSEDPSRRRKPPTPSADTKADVPSSSKQPSPSVDQKPPLPLTIQEQAIISESLPNQPEPCRSDPDVEIDPDYQISPRTHSHIHSLKDVPASEVAQLNIEEVADCLRLLKMAKYIDSFLANQVDGALLQECNEEIFTNDLQMTSLHAKKLVMFAQKGWRPQQGAADDIRL